MTKTTGQMQSPQRSPSPQHTSAVDSSPAFESQPLDGRHTQALSQGWSGGDSRPLQAKIRTQAMVEPTPATDRASRRAQIARVRGDTPLQRKAESGSESAGADITPPTGGGKAMPAPVQAKMESSFGTSFGDVRIHEGSHVSALGAEAYTQGSDIHFAPGRLDVGSQGGQSLLGHELAHVVQQRSGQVTADSTLGGQAANTSPSLETQADRLGEAAANHTPALGALPPSSAPAAAASAPLQRKASPGGSPLQFKGGDKDKLAPKAAPTKEQKAPPKPTSDLAFPEPPTDFGEAPVFPEMERDLSKPPSLDGPEPKEKKAAPSILDDGAPRPATGDELDTITEQIAQVREGTARLQATLDHLVDMLHLDHMKTEYFVPLLEEEIIPHIAPNLFTAEQKKSAEKIATRNSFTQNIQQIGALKEARKEANNNAVDASGKDGAKAQAWTGMVGKKNAQEDAKFDPMKGLDAETRKEIGLGASRDAVESHLRKEVHTFANAAWIEGGVSKWLPALEQNKAIYLAIKNDTYSEVLLPAIHRTHIGQGPFDLEKLEEILGILERRTEAVESLRAMLDKNFREGIRAVSLKNLPTIEEGVKRHFKLGMVKSGGAKDRQAIARHAEQNQGDATQRTLKKRAVRQLESSLAGLSGALGKDLDAEVENPGDFAELNVSLTIPVATGVRILLAFNGALERSDEGVTISFDGQLGASAGLENVLSIQATFGGFIEAKGESSKKALEMMSYSFYRRAQGKLPKDWYDKIWGLGGTVLAGEEAKAWAAYVEERMRGGDYVESGLLGEVSGQIGDTSVLGAGASLKGKTGTRWGKDENDAGITESGIAGANVKVQVGAGIVGIEGSLDVGYRRETRGGKAHDFSLTVGGEVSLDREKLGSSGGEVLDHFKELILRANDRLAAQLAKDEETQKALKEVADKNGFGTYFLSSVQSKAKGLPGAAFDTRKKTAIGGPEEESTHFDFLGGMNDGMGGQESKVADGTFGRLLPKSAPMDRAIRAEKEVKDKVGETVEDKESAALSLSLEFGYSKKDGWSGDVFIKDSTTRSLSLGPANASFTKGHKYNLKNNALSAARRR